MYRIEKVGFSYFVQKYGVVNYDGIRDYNWKDVKRCDSLEEAEEYVREMELYG